MHITSFQLLYLVPVIICLLYVDKETGPSEAKHIFDEFQLL